MDASDSPKAKQLIAIIETLPVEQVLLSANYALTNFMEEFGTSRKMYSTFESTKLIEKNCKTYQMLVNSLEQRYLQVRVNLENSAIRRYMTDAVQEIKDFLKVLNIPERRIDIIQFRSVDLFMEEYESALKDSTSAIELQCLRKRHTVRHQIYRKRNPHAYKPVLASLEHLESMYALWTKWKNVGRLMVEGIQFSKSFDLWKNKFSTDINSALKALFGDSAETAVLEVEDFLNNTKINWEASSLILSPKPTRQNNSAATALNQPECQSQQLPAYQPYVPPSNIFMNLLTSSGQPTHHHPIHFENYIPTHNVNGSPSLPFPRFTLPSFNFGMMPPRIQNQQPNLQQGISPNIPITPILNPQLTNPPFPIPSFPLSTFFPLARPVPSFYPPTINSGYSNPILAAMTSQLLNPTAISNCAGLLPYSTGVPNVYGQSNVRTGMQQLPSYYIPGQSNVNNGMQNHPTNSPPTLSAMNTSGIYVDPESSPEQNTSESSDSKADMPKLERFSPDFEETDVENEENIDPAKMNSSFETM